MSQLLAIIPVETLISTDILNKLKEKLGTEAVKTVAELPLPGDDYLEAAIAGVTEAQAVLFFVEADMPLDWVDDSDSADGVALITAIAQSKRVVSVLVGEAQIPVELPDSITSLKRRAPIRLKMGEAAAFVETLIGALKLESKPQLSLDMSIVDTPAGLATEKTEVSLPADASSVSIATIQPDVQRSIRADTPASFPHAPETHEIRSFWRSLGVIAGVAAVVGAMIAISGIAQIPIIFGLLATVILSALFGAISLGWLSWFPVMTGKHVLMIVCVWAIAGVAAGLLNLIPSAPIPTRRSLDNTILIDTVALFYNTSPRVIFITAIFALIGTTGTVFLANRFIPRPTASRLAMIGAVWGIAAVVLVAIGVLNLRVALLDSHAGVRNAMLEVPLYGAVQYALFAVIGSIGLLKISYPAQVSLRAVFGSPALEMVRFCTWAFHAVRQFIGRRRKAVSIIAIGVVAVTGLAGLVDQMRMDAARREWEAHGTNSVLNGTGTAAEWASISQTRTLAWATNVWRATPNAASSAVNLMGNFTGGRYGGSTNYYLDCSRGNTRGANPAIQLVERLGWAKYSTIQSNIWLSARIENPVNDPESWSYGMVVRYTSPDDHLSLLLRHTGEWVFFGTRFGIPRELASGSMSNFNVGSGIGNQIDLVIKDERASFFVNNAFEATFALSSDYAAEGRFGLVCGSYESTAFRLHVFLDSVRKLD